MGVIIFVLVVAISLTYYLKRDTGVGSSDEATSGLVNATIDSVELDYVKQQMRQYENNEVMKLLGLGEVDKPLGEFVSMEEIFKLNGKDYQSIRKKAKKLKDGSDDEQRLNLKSARLWELASLVDTEILYGYNSSEQTGLMYIGITDGGYETPTLNGVYTERLNMDGFTEYLNKLKEESTKDKKEVGVSDEDNTTTEE